MCFELMKEEFVGKVRWIGRSLRIVNSKGDAEIEGTGNFEEPKGESHNATTVFGSDANLGMVDAMFNGCGANCYRKETHCHSGNFLRSNSPQLRKSICVLRSHSGQCSMHSRSKRSRSSRASSIKSVSQEDMAAIGHDDHRSVTSDTHIEGEDNEAFGEDMTAEEEVNE